MPNTYESPFSSRYASSEMLYLFSEEKKFTTWRRLWIALARAEHKLGLPVSEAQVAELEAFADKLNLDVAREAEKRVRHDVMSHIIAYGEQCPLAKPIIHLGATSCYVGDNTDIIILREGYEIIKKRLAAVISALAGFAMEYRSLPTLGFTHFQPAQMTTVGKRASLWINELLMDLDEIDYRLSKLRLRGVKGTTGTQASFLELFEGDHEKVKQLERLVAEELGFFSCEPVTGQTYSRKIDSAALSAMSGIAQSASKFATDIRLLQHMKEIEEPFETSQVGSSAMPYKRNPMRSERICALARYVMVDSLNPALTSANQWLERTLDDSANRRVSVPEAFLGVDAILNIYMNVASGLVVNRAVIRRHIIEELPFMASENIMMRAVKNGGDRQALHELIRVHSMAAGKRVKEDGLPNNLLELIAGDPAFSLSKDELDELLEPSLYIGRSAEQTEEFVKEYVLPAIKGIGDISVSELNV